eukprot:1161100-Pelagomonas_calceolata.AAC.2
MMKSGRPQITLLALNYPRRAHSSTLRPFFTLKFGQELTHLFDTPVAGEFLQGKWLKLYTSPFTGFLYSISFQATGTALSGQWRTLTAAASRAIFPPSCPAGLFFSRISNTIVSKSGILKDEIRFKMGDVSRRGALTILAPFQTAEGTWTRASAVSSNKVVVMEAANVTLDPGRKSHAQIYFARLKNI